MVQQKAHNQGEANSGFFFGFIVVIAAFIIMGIMWGTFHAFGVFFTPMQTEFGWTTALIRSKISIALALSLIVSGFSAILMGRLTDKIGPRLVLTICGFLLGAGYLLISQV